ncbi:MAG: hypothetical protein QM752_07115 [Gammaproteobacteria bacterium]
MPSFRSAKQQASHAVQKKLHLKQACHTHRDEKTIHSLGTARNYTQALMQLTQWLQQNKLGGLKQLTVEIAKEYLGERCQVVGQKMLDQERQAIQLHLGIKLLVIRSELPQMLR